jgi:hypothetical protein
VPFDRDQIKQKVAALAAEGVFIGTSSWKYPGWRGMLLAVSDVSAETVQIVMGFKKGKK